MRLVIKGSEWARGVRGEYALYDGERFCCLGVHARACGVDPYAMRGHGLPGHLHSYGIEIPDDRYMEWVDEEDEDGEFNIGAAWEAASVNDSAAYRTDEERIADLRPLFKEVGVTLVWRPDL